MGDIGEACEICEAKRMKRRSWRDRKRGIASAFDEEPRAERDAALSLTPTGPEAGVALERLDVGVSAFDGVLEAQSVGDHVEAGHPPPCPKGQPGRWLDTGEHGVERLALDLASEP